jgi:phosphotriesterase-related protein
MAEVMTVLGSVRPDSLGFTSMHDHILLDGCVYRRRWGVFVPTELHGMWNDPIRLDNIYLLKKSFPLLRDNLVIDDEELMAAELTDFKSSGGSTIVDMSSVGLRLSVQGIQRLSRKTGVHVVTSTGLYTEDSWPEAFLEMPGEQFTKFMLKEINEGIGDSGIRAGHIKIAVTDLSERQERLMKAAVEAAICTGASITVHPGYGIGNDGRRIADIMIGNGMKPERLIVSHADAFLIDHRMLTAVMDPSSWQLRLDYHKAVLDRGVNLTFDCFGHWWDTAFWGEVSETDTHRMAGLIALIKAGYSRQLMLGADTFMKMQTRRFGGGGYCELTKGVIPTLRSIGVSDFEIRQMTVENPARLLAK